ncbi:MAG: type I restriction enzyme HsdR N-terminal domain-containing protein [Nitrospinae bacterium]|nr:type I restriction enzyme HsdR N-terminal domain-containing protein [Nitrospinota bacterium]
MAIDITKNLKKYIPLFQQANEQKINEAETSLRIGKFLEEVLDYDVFQDITKEFTVKDRYVDYAIKVNGKVAFFIEVKQAGITLREKHIEQAENYAANAGVEWLVLTNGGHWHLYHLTFEDGIQSSLVFSANLFEDDIKDASYKLAHLHKKSILKYEHNEYYEKVKTLSPKSVVQAILQENVLKLIRLSLKKTSGIAVEEQDLVDSIKKMISSETWESIGDIRVKRKKKKASKQIGPTEQPGKTAAQEKIQNTPSIPMETPEKDIRQS